MPAKTPNGSDKLLALDWKYNGLWWISPHTGHRYAKREALAVEELRKWAASDSAILQGKGHSMWVLKELEDNKLITMEELSKRSQQAKLLRGIVSRSNFTGKGTD